jgi:hypothetical protein
MASSAYRNGVHRGSSGMKLDRPLPAANLKSSSFKSRIPPSQSSGSALRRSSPASFAARDNDGGEFHSKHDPMHYFVYLLFYFLQCDFILCVCAFFFFGPSV